VGRYGKYSFPDGISRRLGAIQVTVATYERLRDKYVFQERGVIPVKGKGDMMTYLLLARNA
jgi:hypothetical protein